LIANHLAMATISFAMVFTARLVLAP